MRLVNGNITLLGENNSSSSGGEIGYSKIYYMSSSSPRKVLWRFLCIENALVGKIQCKIGMWSIGLLSMRSHHHM